jgi:WXG100 family type VII secretion target
MGSFMIDTMTASAKADTLQAEEDNILQLQRNLQDAINAYMTTFKGQMAPQMFDNAHQRWAEGMNAMLQALDMMEAKLRANANNYIARDEDGATFFRMA